MKNRLFILLPYSSGIKLAIFLVAFSIKDGKISGESSIRTRVS